MSMNALDLRNVANTSVDLLPAEYEAEQYVLGILLYNNEVIAGIDSLEPHHFREMTHGKIFTVCREHIAKGLLADPITVWNVMSGDAALIELGGLGYLGDLVDTAPPTSNFRDYVRLIVETAMRRHLIEVSDEMRSGALTPHTPPKMTLEAAESALYQMGRESTGAGGFIPFSDAVDQAIDMAAEAYSRDGALSGLSTGLTDLDKKLGGLHPSDLIILAGRPSMGKAQPLDAKILMADGSWRTMGELRFGDDLASVDGAPSRVVGIYPQGVRETYRVRLGDGRSTRACGEHLWSVRSCKLPRGEAVVSTDQLRTMLDKERFSRRVSLPMISGHFGFNGGLMIDPWLLGAMIGNGCMTEGHLDFSTADAATLYRVQAVVGHERIAATGSGYDYRISRAADLGLAQALRVYGLDGKRSEEKFIPPAYLTAERESRLELLRGLMDTDGWVETFGVLRYGTASKQLARDVQALVRSLGGSCTISSKTPHFTHKGERKAGQRAYVCNIRHADRASLLSLTRKKRRCQAPARFKSPTIVSIEAAGAEPVQCIMVSHPSSLYVTDDYIVTHNTALATNIAFHLAKNYAYETQPDGTRKTTAGGQVAFYSLEMSEDQLASRILSQTANLPSDKIRRGDISAIEFGLLRDAGNDIRSIPLHIDATGGISISKLAARARRLKRRGGLDLIVVDYLQLITTDNRQSGSNRTQEVTEITGGLKALAKELGVPIIALSQLSRKVEERPDKRPQLSDLRESGSIEQDSDAVLFVYREEYYLKREEPDSSDAKHLAWLDKVNKVHGIAEVIIGKQRHGPIGTVRLHFNDDTTTFSNLVRRSEGYGEAG